MLIHTVEKGESLWQIAKEQQISLDALLAANPQIPDPNFILPGSRLNIPQMTDSQPPQTEPPHQAQGEDCCCNTSGARPCIYISQGGETLQNISADWHIPMAQIHYHNYQYPQNMQLPAGERIIIPAAASYYTKPQPPRRRSR